MIEFRSNPLLAPALSLERALRAFTAEFHHPDIITLPLTADKIILVQSEPTNTA